jgi:Terpene cyclase DEP1
VAWLPWLSVSYARAIESLPAALRRNASAALPRTQNEIAMIAPIAAGRFLKAIIRLLVIVVVSQSTTKNGHQAGHEPNEVNMRALYLTLAAIGAVLPYSQFVPWLLQHGPDVPLLFTELFSTKVGAFFGLDVLISAAASIAFIRREGAKRKISMLWLPIAATCLIGVSCGLPLFLYQRELHAAAD